MLRMMLLCLPAMGCGTVAAAPAGQDLSGQPADLVPSAYQYRKDRPADQNDPESWILVMRNAGQDMTRPPDLNSPGIKQTLCAFLWEEVRRLRRVEVAWNDARMPPPGEIALAYAEDQWWKAAPKKIFKHESSPDGRTLTFDLPRDAFGILVCVAAPPGGEPRDASAYSVPTVRAFGPDLWKRMDLEIEWGYEPSRAGLDYGGTIAAYDGLVSGVKPLPGDGGTAMTAAGEWRSAGPGGPRRGISLNLHCIGTSPWRKAWPGNPKPEFLPRTIVTLRTKSGGFSFLAADLENGPILAPEYGFFARAAGAPSPGTDASHQPPFPMQSQAASARAFVQELEARGLKTVRQRTRGMPEQTWERAVATVRPGLPLPPHPQPPYEPAMQVDVPDARLAAQWKLGAWHLTRHAKPDENGRLRFNTFPFGVLAEETHLDLLVLDMMGFHKQAAEGFDQWLSLPLDTKRTKQAGHNLDGGGEPDRPCGYFSEGRGCFTNAVGPKGVGGHLDGVHSMGPGMIGWAMVEHCRLSGDMDWFKAHAPRIKANAEWILRQRELLSSIIPGGRRLWCKGLQPAHQTTPDAGGLYAQFHHTEAYYWLAVRSLADALAGIDPAESARLSAEADAYRTDILAAVDRSILLTPVVAVRDGTYRSWIPFACYVRGFASVHWMWRRQISEGHWDGIGWDASMPALPLVSPAGLLPPGDPRVQGCLDVLEDRVLLENVKVRVRKKDHDPERDWFDFGSWHHQGGYEYNANAHLAADDAPNFLRSLLNLYATDINPANGYTFIEHTTRGPADKPFEEAAFLRRFRRMLVCEEGRDLWLARAVPRAWLDQGKRIAVKDAPTPFGIVAFEIVSEVDKGRITAKVEMPSRLPPAAVLLRLRHPRAAPIKSVTVNGKDWTSPIMDKETIELKGLTGTVTVRALY